MGKSSSSAEPKYQSSSSSRDTSKSSSSGKATPSSSSSGSRYGKPEIHYSQGQGSNNYTRTGDSRYHKESNLSEGYGGRR